MRGINGTVPSSSHGSVVNDGMTLKVLWVLHLDYNYDLAHGGHLRFFNYARRLVDDGHEVYFAVRIVDGVDTSLRQDYLENLKKQKVITDYYEIKYNHPKVRGKLARLLISPNLGRRVLSQNQGYVIEKLKSIITIKNINLFLITDRSLLFTISEIKSRVLSIIDWCDCYTLFHRRESAIKWNERKFWQWIKTKKNLFETWVDERYYSRKSDANIVVSPMDKECLDEVSGQPEKNYVLLNGVTFETMPSNIEKIKGRIIFSGNMDFRPNYESALWFIKNVFPLLLSRRPELKLVIAGTNPVEELCAHACESIEVTGFVNDIRHEIAKSEIYVAPLICGGGFKNKVVEAIMSGTYLVATKMAVEFLDQRLQRQILVADKPQEIADAILTYLENPASYETKLKNLQEIIKHEFTWENRTADFVNIVKKAGLR